MDHSELSNNISSPSTSQRRIVEQSKEQKVRVAEWDENHKITFKYIVSQVGDTNTILMLILFSPKLLT